MASDDWRLKIKLEEESLAADLLDRLGLDLSPEAKKLASDLEAHRLAVSRDGDEIFVYASTRQAIEQAKTIVETEIAQQGLVAKEGAIEHWLADEDRWDDEPPQPDVEEAVLDEGYAPWEVRVKCETHEEARELADKLEAEGYGVARRFHHVMVGTATEEQARELAHRLHGEVEPGGELVYETMPQNPFAVFGGLGG